MKLKADETRLLDTPMARLQIYRFGSPERGEYLRQCAMLGPMALKTLMHKAIRDKDKDKDKLLASCLIDCAGRGTDKLWDNQQIAAYFAQFDVV